MRAKKLLIMASIGLAILLGACTGDDDNTNTSDNNNNNNNVQGKDLPTEVSVTFNSTDEAYLLGVIALPEDEAAPDDFVTFSLNAGPTDASDTQGALKIRSLAKKRTMSSSLDRKYWQSRIAFESQRRIQIEQLILDLRQGLRNLAPSSLIRQGSCNQDCGNTQMCWHGACTDSPTLNLLTDNSSLPCDLVGVVGDDIQINVLVDANDTAADNSAMLNAATAFSISLQKALDYLGQSGGHSGSIDRDSDLRMTIVYSNKLSNLGIVGAFQYKDFLPSSDSDATGNEADLLWAVVPEGNISEEMSVGTLVHEYTHLVNFAKRVYENSAAPEDNEVLWLDEGMAHLMEDITGWGASNIGTVIAALDEWPSTTFASPIDTVEQRGKAYLLLRYILDQQGRAQGANDAQAANQAYKLHQTLLNEKDKKGFLHKIIHDMTGDGFWEWLVAVYATNQSDVTNNSIESYSYLPVGDAATGQITGFDPYGTYVDASGDEIELAGPTLGDGSVEEIDDLSETLESEVAVSGSVMYLLTGIESGEFTIKLDADKNAKIYIKAVKVW